MSASAHYYQVDPARRVSNWPAALHRFIAERRTLPFAWGSNDCCLFTCDAIHALTGFDLAADLRGTYDSAATAAAVLAAHGGVEALADSRCTLMGWPRVPATLARRGDVVCLDMDTRPTLGVCLGALSAFAGRDGIVTHPTLNARAAWRIA